MNVMHIAKVASYSVFSVNDVLMFQMSEVVRLQRFMPVLTETSFLCILVINMLEIILRKCCF
jgi:hypothetical protein